MDKLKQETGISYREAILFRGCAMVIAATRGSSRHVDLARADHPEAIALLMQVYGDEAIEMGMELVYNAKHLCDSCRKDFANCDGRDKAYGCDFGLEEIPEEADKILVCAGYEARPAQPSVVPGPKCPCCGLDPATLTRECPGCGQMMCDMCDSGNGCVCADCEGGK